VVRSRAGRRTAKTRPDPKADEPGVEPFAAHRIAADLDGLLADAEAGYYLRTWPLHRPSSWTALDGPRRFELAGDIKGWWIYAYVTWGAKSTTVGGLASSLPFASPSDAFAWAEEQDGLPMSTWQQAGGPMLDASDRRAEAETLAREVYGAEDESFWATPRRSLGMRTPRETLEAGDADAVIAVLAKALNGEFA